MPASVIPTIMSGLNGSSVLVDGSVCIPTTGGACTPATARAGVGAAVGAATGAMVGATVAIGAAVGATVWPGGKTGAGIGVAVGAGVASGRSGRSDDPPPLLGAAGAPLHVDVTKVSLIIVTVPFRASALPLTVTPFASVMDVRARIVPTKEDPDPRLAELVTCQKTLQGLPPLTKLTELDDAVTRSDVAWKIQTEFGSFWPSSVSVPVRPSVAPPAL